MWDAPLLIALFAADVFVAITAVGGGLAIVTGMERNNFPGSWLEGTPFSSFTIPGVLLAALVGGSALAASIALPLSSGLGTVLALVSGLVLTGWIIGEIRMLNTPGISKTEAIYLLLGLAIIGISIADLVK